MVDGRIRDQRELAGLDMPVFSRGTSVVSAGAQTVPWATQVPIKVGDIDVRPGDVIVLAGKGHETYQEIQGVQYPMDEREIVAQYFSSAPSWERTGNLPAGVV